MPRNEKLGWVLPYGLLIWRFGTALASSAELAIPCRASVSPSRAVIARGTAEMDWARLCAVTTISSSCEVAPGASAVVADSAAAITHDFAAPSNYPSNFRWPRGTNLADRKSRAIQAPRFSSH